MIVLFQAEDGIRDLVRSRGLGDVYKRQTRRREDRGDERHRREAPLDHRAREDVHRREDERLSLIHI